MTESELEQIQWITDAKEPNPPLVTLANGAPFPSRITARTAIGDGPTITFSVAVEDGVPVMTHFAIDRRVGGPGTFDGRRPGPPVTASAIHNMPVAGLFDRLISYLGWRAQLLQTGYDEPGATHAMPSEGDRDAWGSKAVSSQRGRPVSDDDLRKVAEIVKDNEYNPRQQLKETLNLSKRTASRWIAEAKRRGFLNDASSKESDQ